MNKEYIIPVTLYKKDGSKAYRIDIHRLPLFTYFIWKFKAKVAWALCKPLQKFPALHSWWVDNMEIKSSLALEVRNTIAYIDITEEQYRKLK